MSELTNANQIGRRLQLLATVSAVALLGGAYSLGEARADAENRNPTVWIELGGQLSRLDNGQEGFSPAFPVARPSVFSPSEIFEKPSHSSVDETGKISFEPEGSDWSFSASIRYGRSTSKRDVRQQTHPKSFAAYGNGTQSGHPTIAKYNAPIANKFADTNARNSESHTVLDFQVGKDVGLGLFGGHHGSSVLNLGVRFAQFSAKSNVAIKSDPDWHFAYKYALGLKFAPYQPYHTNQANFEASHTFRGIGPSLSWNASSPLFTAAQDSEFALDWGVNAAALFGRQRARVHHDAQAQYHPISYGNVGERTVTYSPAPVNLTRSRSIIVPNVGGFAGFSFRYTNAKISAGYRADFFFGAMDGGIDSLKTYDRGFFGPFATISIGFP